MDRFLEYATRHPFLVGGTAALAMAVAAYELSKLRAGGQSVGPSDAVRLMNQGALLLDVRTPGRVRLGPHPRREARAAGTGRPGRRDLQAVQGQGRGALLRERRALRRRGQRVLRAQGFTKVVNLRGGLQAWRAESLPLVKGDANKGK